MILLTEKGFGYSSPIVTQLIIYTVFKVFKALSQTLISFILTQPCKVGSVVTQSVRMPLEDCNLDLSFRKFRTASACQEKIEFVFREGPPSVLGEIVFVKRL